MRSRLLEPSVWSFSRGIVAFAGACSLTLTWSSDAAARCDGGTCYWNEVTTEVCTEESFDCHTETVMELDHCDCYDLPPCIDCGGGGGGGSGGSGGGSGGPPAPPPPSGDSNGDGKMDCWQGSVSTIDPQAAVLDAGDNLGKDFGGPDDGVRADHNGIDVQCDLGDDVRSVATGTVSEVGFSDANGFFVRVNHGADGYQSTYIHLEGYTVSKGQRVNVGNKIATCDSTGESTGHHLHLTIRDKPKGAIKNPETYSGTCP